MKRTTILIFLSLLASCTNETELSVNICSPDKVLIDNHSNDTDCVSLRENVAMLGNITSAKGYINSLFMFAEDALSIYQYDASGNQLAVLDKIGRAEWEYIDIGTYAYLPKSNILAIYERSSKSFKLYDADSMSFIKSIQVDYYVNAMESTDDGYLAIVKEASDDDGALLILDASSFGIVSEIPLREDQADLMMDTCFSKNNNGELFITIPGYPNKVLAFENGSLNMVQSFYIRPSVLSRKYWAGSFNQAKMQQLMEAFEHTDQNSAIVPAFFTNDETSAFAFWYVTPEYRYPHNYPSMNLFVTGCQNPMKMYSSSLEKPLTPIGTWYGKYLFIIEDGNSTNTSYRLIKYSF